MKHKNEKQRKTRPSTPVKVSSASEWTDASGLLELFGLRRSALYYLVKTEPMLADAAISLASEKKKRGKRLFNVGKFRRFLESKVGARRQHDVDSRRAAKEAA